MRILAWVGFCVGMWVCTVCDSRSPFATVAEAQQFDAGVAPAAEVLLPEVTVPTTPSPKPRVSEELRKRCYKDLDRAIRGPHRARGGSSAELLEDIQDACVGILSPQIREGARQAMPVRGLERIRRLTEALRGLVPEECLRNPETMSWELPAACHMPTEPSYQGSKRLCPLDAASYMFALTVRRQFLEAGATDNSDTQCLSLEFILRSCNERSAHPEEYDFAMESKTRRSPKAVKRALIEKPE